MGVILPQTAVLSDEQGNYVLIVDADNRVRATRRDRGRHPLEGLLVSAGLTGTERVVAIAGAFLRIGEHVVVASSPSARPPAAPTAPWRT